MISCKDHTGKEWKSRRKMCEYYGVTPSTFVWRRMSGMSLEEALDNKTDNRCCEVSDHLGNRYKSMREIAKAYGLKYSTLRARLTLFMDLERALTTPVRELKKKKTKESKNEIR